MESQDTTQYMRKLGSQARAAATQLAIADTSAKNKAIRATAKAVLDQSEKIIQANAIDMDNATKNGLSKAMIDRLKLDQGRIESIANGLNAIAELDDPVGTMIADWDRPNGLRIQRVRTPLGVIGVIYESRPNVTADAGALCLKAGNAVILRGGSDSIESSTAIHRCLVAGLQAAGLPGEAVQVVATTDRAAVGEMLTGLDGNVDVIVPRGGKSLVGRVQSECRVPVFAHLEGICHTYVDATADVAMAVEIVDNAKMRRTGICGATETLLIEKSALDTHLVPILERLRESGCEIRGDEEVCSRFQCNAATEEDWSTEYLDSIISVRTVADVSEAIQHVQSWSSGHTEAIVSENAAAVERFLNEIDSAILMHNASTQFADGGEFGMGAEIGIATGKMHARGPVGVEQLTSFNYRVRGAGQVRPR